MFKERRLNELLQYITKNSEVSVQELSEHFNVSTMTVRRDLASLEQSNLISRAHGGAIALDVLQSEEMYENKQTQNYEVKQKISDKALSLVINPKDNVILKKSIFLDAGTTNYQIATQLKKYSGFKLFTNDIKIASDMYHSMDVCIIGGHVQSETGSVFGSFANSFIDALNFDICFVGVSAISPTLILTTPSEEKSISKQSIMKQSSTKVLACDKSKFNKISLYNISSICKFDYVITDFDFNAVQHHLLESSGTKVIHI